MLSSHRQPVSAARIHARRHTGHASRTFGLLAATLGLSAALAAPAIAGPDVRADIVALYPNGDALRVANSTGTRFSSQVFFFGWMNQNLTDVKVGDVNGDGMGDAVTRQPNGGDLEVRISNGETFVGTSSWNRQYNNGGQPWHLADVNGDGKADLVYRDQRLQGAEPSGNPAGSGLVYVSLSNGSSFGPTQSFGSRLSLTDLKFADVNGDGKADMVARQPGGGSLEVSISNGTSFVGTSSWNCNFNNSGLWYLADVNGDRRADLVFRNATTSKMWVALSKAATNNFGNTNADCAWQDFGDRPGALTDLRFGDVDGDGKADMVARQPGGGDTEVSISNGSTFVGTSSWNQSLPGLQPWFLADVGRYYQTSVAYGNSGGAADVVDTQQEADNVAALLRGSTNAQAEEHRAGLRPAELTFASNRFKSLKPYSHEYGGPNWKLDTDAEADYYIWALRTDTDANTVQSDTFNKLDASERDVVSARNYATYRYSREYGGPNWKIDTTTEADNFISALRSDTDANTVVSNALNKMFPEDRDYVTARNDVSFAFSRTFGGPNWKVDTVAEADNFIAALRGSSDAATIQSDAINKLNSGDRAYVENRMDVGLGYPSARSYGGPNWKVDTSVEADTYLAAFRGATSDGAANALYQGLPGNPSTDKAYADLRAAATREGTSVLRDVVSQQAYVYWDGVKRRLADAPVRQLFDVAVGAPNRASTGELAAIQSGSDITESNYSDDIAEQSGTTEWKTADTDHPVALSSNDEVKGYGTFVWSRRKGIFSSAKSKGIWSEGSVWAVKPVKCITARVYFGWWTIDASRTPARGGSDKFVGTSCTSDLTDGYPPRLSLKDITDSHYLMNTMRLQVCYRDSANGPALACDDTTAHLDYATK